MILLHVKFDKLQMFERQMNEPLNTTRRKAVFKSQVLSLLKN